MSGFVQFIEIIYYSLEPTLPTLLTDYRFPVEQAFLLFKRGFSVLIFRRGRIQRELNFSFLGGNLIIWGPFRASSYTVSENNSQPEMCSFFSAPIVAPTIPMNDLGAIVQRKSPGGGEKGM